MRRQRDPLRTNVFVATFSVVSWILTGFWLFAVPLAICCVRVARIMEERANQTR